MTTHTSSPSKKFKDMSLELCTINFTSFSLPYNPGVPCQELLAQLNRIQVTYLTESRRHEVLSAFLSFQLRLESSFYPNDQTYEASLPGRVPTNDEVSAIVNRTLVPRFHDFNVDEQAWDKEVYYPLLRSVFCPHRNMYVIPIHQRIFPAQDIVDFLFITTESIKKNFPTQLCRRKK